MNDPHRPQTSHARARASSSSLARRHRWATSWEPLGTHDPHRSTQNQTRPNVKFISILPCPAVRGMDLFASLRSRDGQRVHSRPRSTHLIRFKTRRSFFFNNVIFSLQGVISSLLISPRTKLFLLIGNNYSCWCIVYSLFLLFHGGKGKFICIVLYYHNYLSFINYY